MAKGMLKYADNTEKGPSMTGRGEAGKTPLPCKCTGLVSMQPGGINFTELKIHKNALSL